MDTIFALASAPGKAGVSVIRISGNLAHNALQKLTGSLPDTRQAKLATLRDHSGEVLDHALVLRFDGPSSFTGEDVVELHCHGSRSVVASVLSELGRHEGFRLADPGEFTRRALENGRLDLTQVEGLADLIDAETDAQRKQAQRVFSGVLGGAVEGWRKALIRAAALIEATIDFADEDVPTDVSPEVNALLASVLSDLTREVAGVVVAERIRDGFEVAIVGPPNAGKSTLLNYLAGREAAITSEQAGTTRDIIEVRMDLAGLPVTFLDTAGLRETDDVLEQAGISRALSRAKAADLRVFLSDGDQLPLDVEQGDLVLRPKADLRADPGEGVSGATGDGVAKMLAQISEELTNRAQSVGIATRLRHKSGMQSAMRHLTEAQAVLVSGPEHYDIAAEELRCAIRALEALTGRIDVENLLDEIFASFCLGK